MVVRTTYSSITKILICVVLFMLFVVQANAASSPRVQYLLHLFDLNEAAFAYHRHCIGQSEKLNSKFLRGMEVVADELYEAVLEDEPKMSTEFIKSRIIERRYSIQYRYDQAHIQYGCVATQYAKAREHYEEFSNLNISEIRKIIRRGIDTK